MTENMTAAASVAILIYQELPDDYVGLWKVPWHIRRALPAAADDQVQAMAASVLQALLASHVAIGSMDETIGLFHPWRSHDALESMMGSWLDLGRDPSLGEVAWLALTS